MFRDLKEEMNKVREKSYVRAIKLFAAELAELETRYPRHKFAIHSGQGSTSMEVTPPVLGEKNVEYIYYPREGLLGDTIEELGQRWFHLREQIEDYESEWGIPLGVVTSSTKS